jgi:hypothetical protein
MNRDDIIRMVDEARLTCVVEMFESELEHFAALVAAAERNAMVVEAAKKGWSMKNEDSFEDAVREIAAIRARRNT